MKKNILIVGGSSGLGLELAKYYVSDGHTVCVTGRRKPALNGVQFESLDITDDSSAVSDSIDSLLTRFTRINTLIYVAGFRQRGTIDEIDDAAIATMINVGLQTPALLIQRLKNTLPTPLKVMLVTSSSQYTPRENEPVYCAVKAGLGMLGAAIVRDKAIGKVLVAAPSGINTNFWAGSNEDTSTMLDAKWVSDAIVELSSGAFKYKYAKILRNPARIEIQETLDNDLNPINSM